MGERPFEVAIAGASLRGHRGGSGPPALLLHGGAAVPQPGVVRSAVEAFLAGQQGPG